MQVLAPKLHLPRLHAALIARERLLAQLDAGLERKLTLLSAPAGFGKTTLVSQWVTERRNAQQLPAVAWVSLDPDDNDPTRFWSYVMMACQDLQRTIARSVLTMLHSAQQNSFETSPLDA